MKYRVNYGNGQVSDTFTSLTAARKEMKNDRDWNTRHGRYSPPMMIQVLNEWGEWETAERELERSEK